MTNIECSITWIRGSVEYIHYNIYQTSELCFSRALIGSIPRNPRVFLARMTAHEIDNMVSRFPESLSEAQVSEIMRKPPQLIQRLLDFSLSNILRLNFKREAVYQLPSLFTNFKIQHKKYKDYNLILHWITGWYMLMCLSAGEKPSIFTSTSGNNC